MEAGVEGSSVEISVDFGRPGAEAAGTALDPGPPPIELSAGPSAGPFTADAAILDTAVNSLRRLWPAFSAATLPLAGIYAACATLVAVPAIIVLAGTPDPAVLALSTLPFVSIVMLRASALWLWGTGRLRQELAPTLPDDALPIYSLLVPLCREVPAVPGLVRALSALDYPRDKLEIFFITEADDAATRSALAAAPLEPCMYVLTVPDGLPRTKPRALNFALQLASGDVVAIFDAEDQPEPDQLRRAAECFAAGSPKLACVQAPLQIYNATENLLTRQFALEYAALFDAFLPALQRMGLPLPLGGTSNHFRRDVLVAAGAWDPFNVTEDADLGFRLARLGYDVALINSTTWEEAPPKLVGWFRQRTRWLKGWLVTYLVQMRAPTQLLHDFGVRRFLGFQAILAGMILSALVHPWFYIMLGWSAVKGGGLTMPAFSAEPVRALLWWLSLSSLALSYAVSMGLGVLARARRGFNTRPNTLLFLPVYWLLISAAAYWAVVELLLRPHHWAKTEHRGIAAATGG